MEPVDPIDDYLTTRGTVQPGVTLRTYDPTKDPSGSDPWAGAIEIRGSHGVERTVGGRGEGDNVYTETTWYITSKTPAEPFERPTINSKIGACGKVWLILDVAPNPRNGKLYRCETQLSRGG